MNDDEIDQPTERAFDPALMARDKSDEFRMHAELAAVFEACRKFEARLIPGLHADIARQVQRGVATLEKARIPETPFIVDASATDAAALLNLPEDRGLSTSDYHIHRRPGEVMIVRWLSGEEVETFYVRLQAHFDAALGGFRQEERSAKAWQQDAKTLAFLDALDAMDVQLAGRFYRQQIRDHGVFALSTQSADEMNIAYLSDFIMGVPPADLVGPVNAPPEERAEKDLTWFFKLFLLRGLVDGVEKMCFFAYLQKSDDSFEFDD